VLLKVILKCTFDLEHNGDELFKDYNRYNIIRRLEKATGCGHSSYIAYIDLILLECLPIPVVEPSKAWVCSRSPAGIAGSNPAEGMVVCCECSVFLR
jgi:hypothetical protein